VISPPSTAKTSQAFETSEIANFSRFLLYRDTQEA